MSHFTVLVMGENPEKQLAPYHEFECTGYDDEYVQDIDKTDELRQDYEKHTETRLRAADGSLHSFFDDAGNWRPEFSQAETDALLGNLGCRKQFVPPGYEVVEVPTKDVESFAQFIEGWSGQKVVAFGEQPDTDGEHKYGYVLTDAAGEVVKVIDRTNPNKKWDWHQLGGRWTGFFILKPGRKGETGSPSLMTEAAEHGKADAALKCNIDFTAMRDEAEQKARARYRKFFALLGDKPLPQSWEAIRAAHAPDIAAASTAYHNQAGIIATREDDELRWADDPGKEFACTEDEHAEKARECAISTFALVKDGQWFEHGRMGWWGCVHDEKDQDLWNREFAKLLDSVNSNTLLSVYDCHI
jgi:hypothetical protein